MAIATVGLDLVRPEFPLVGYDARFKEVKRRTLRRYQVLEFFERLAPCQIGMELCAGSHHWGREFSRFGHEVKLIPTQHVAHVLRDKNKGFFNDARVMASALSQPDIPSVSVKTMAQQDLHTIHRMHSQCIKERSSLCNLTHRLLAEYGISVPKGVAALRRHIPAVLTDADNGLSDQYRRILSRRYEQLLELDGHLSYYAAELAVLTLPEDVGQNR